VGKRNWFDPYVELPEGGTDYASFRKTHFWKCPRLKLGGYEKYPLDLAQSGFV